MKKLLFIFCLLGIFRAEAMNITSEEKRTAALEIENKINNHHWLGVVYSIADGNVTFNDVSAYTEVTLNQPDEKGNTLLQNLLYILWLQQSLNETEKCQRLQLFLKALIQSDKVTHNEQLTGDTRYPDNIKKDLLKTYRAATNPQAQQFDTPPTQLQQPNKTSNGKYITGAVILVVAALCVYKYYTNTSKDDSEDSDDESEENVKIDQPLLKDS